MRDIKQCHPRLQLLVDKLIKECEKQGLKIGIGECFRTVGEQDALYAQGRTKAGSIVTNAKGSTYSSMHQWGIAFDFYRNDNKGAFDDTGNFFTKVGKVGQRIGLEWGGSWKSPVDKPHFQLPDWGSTTSILKSQYGTLNKFKATWGKIVKPIKPMKTVTTKSTTGEVLWVQIKANIVIKRTILTDETGRKLGAIAEDGKYGAKSQEFTRAYWRLLGWENSDTIGNAGLKTINALDIWE